MWCIDEIWWDCAMQNWIIQSFLLSSFLSTLICFIMVTYSKFSSKNSVYKTDIKLYGKTVLITGANSGIGLETARDLAARGARLILAVGNMEKGINAAKDIVETTGNNNLVVRKLDLASIEEVRKFAQQVNDAEEKLDILILNGNMGCQVFK